MRILALTNLYPNPYEPQRAPFNRQQFRELAKHHPLAVIAPIHWIDEWRARRVQGARLPSNRCVAADGVRVDHPSYFYPPRILRGWYGHFFRQSVARAFQRALQEFRPQLVFASWAYPDGWAAVKLGHQAGLPVVIKVHGSDVLRLEEFPGRRQRTLEALQQADGVIAVSQDLARQVMGLGVDPERVEVVYNGVDTHVFSPGQRPAARARLGSHSAVPWILFIGGLLPIKGPQVLVDACALLANEMVPFECHMVGHGPMRAKLARQIARLGLENQIRLQGSIPHEHLPDWYRSANVVVVPSLTEGVPNVLLEAAASWIPFVASRVGGIPEIAHLGWSHLVPPGDAPALAEAIGQILTSAPQASPELAGPMRNHAQAAFELTAVFENVLNSCRPQLSHATMWT